MVNLAFNTINICFTGSVIGLAMNIVMMIMNNYDRDNIITQDQFCQCAIF